MWRYPKNLDRCCIYRVPDCMREVKPEAYTPQLVLIGPLHRPLKFQALKALDRGDDITYTKSIDYLNMEQHKKYYLAAFAERFEGEEIIDGFRRMIEEEEEKIRESYSESTAWIKSSEFVEMVLHDSVFIIEFTLRFRVKGRKKIGDPLMDRGCFVNTLFKDLILLENLLPYFILEKLFDQIVQRILPQKTFRDLIISFFNLQGKIGDDSKFRHFTDLQRLEMTLRNIMALEQCHYPFNAHVCSYILFIDRLIHTKKAADLLIEKGIIKNRTRERHPVKQMVNKLMSGIAVTGSYYFHIEGEVNKYSENRVNRSKAVLKRVFFGNVLSGTATIDGACLSFGREGTVLSSQVSRCYWTEEKDNPGYFFFFSFLLSLFPFLFSLPGHGDSMAIRSLSVAFIDGTARALLVELGDEGKPRLFYRWLFSTLGNGEKRRETVTSLSIGGSLTRSIPDTVAAEPNRKRNDSAGLIKKLSERDCVSVGVLLKTHHTCSSHKGPTIHHRDLMKSPYLIFTEFSPLADPLFEPGRPGESAVEQGLRVLASFYLLPYHQLVLLTAYPRAAATTKIIREEVKAYNRDNILQKVKRHPTLSKSEFFGPTKEVTEDFEMKVTAQVIQHKGGDMTLKYAVKPKKKRKNKTV
ncbi:hypothetical protein DY000_02032126 [Brassica cretica]|uniref:Uncharacterized protein n=2 Tax=Brassica cretica TaxID=69181 RepID=A0ABQ7DCX0_BRACR|nr:hypothetical protein DY000_02032126 [Brassica cretica]